MKHTQYVQNFVAASIANGVLMTFPLLVGISLLVRFPDHQITYIQTQQNDVVTLPNHNYTLVNDRRQSAHFRLLPTLI